MLTQGRIDAAMADLVIRDPVLAEAHGRLGSPAPRIRTPGHATLLRTIVGQQISVAAAAGIWRRLETLLGDPDDPARLAATSDADLRAAGLSRQKIAYARSLAAHVADGRLPLDALPADDEEAIGRLSAVAGIGRWSAEVYLLFAEGRADVFPGGDLAVRAAAGRLWRPGTRPSEREVRALAERWRPWRGVAALFLWHCYGAVP